MMQKYFEGTKALRILRDSYLSLDARPPPVSEYNEDLYFKYPTFIRTLMLFAQLVHSVRRCANCAAAAA